MAFSPRLNDQGILGNLHWYSADNPYYPNYGMPNCTCYAWGRFWEVGDPLSQGIHKPDPSDLPGGWDGGFWWREVDRSVYQTGQVPQLGAVICFWDEDGGGAGGHVAIVEEIINGGDSIVTSNSAYQSTYFYTQTLYRSNNYNWTGSNGHQYTFQGFIYNPYSDSPTPTPSLTSSKFPWVLYSRKIRERRNVN